MSVHRGPSPRRSAQSLRRLGKAVVAFALVLPTFAGCERRDQGSASTGSASTELVPGVETEAPNWQPASNGVDAEELRLDAEQAMRDKQCNRCHSGGGMTPPPLMQQCVGCHQEIHSGEFEAPPETLAQWQTRVVHFRAVPSLDGLQRLRSDWIEQYLAQPVDVRPGLAESMPRLPLSGAERQAIARTLGQVQRSHDAELAKRLVDAQWEDGLAAYRRHECGRCHSYSGVAALRSENAAIDNGAVPTAMAPDLRHARDRMYPDAMDAWLKNPRRVLRESLMPAFQGTPTERAALIKFLFEAPLSPEGRRPAPPRLRLLEREISYDEVEKRVFKDSCWHCHAEPSFARGDGGPGNTGGFGFVGAGVSFTEYENLLSGYRNAQGRRVSLFKKERDGQGRLMLTLLARQAEERGEVDLELRGMPLGMPALTPEQIQLVESWIAQGRPR